MTRAAIGSTLGSGLGSALGGALGTALARALAAAEAGSRLGPAEAFSLADCDEVARLGAVAAALTVAGHGDRVSFSKKVFIPLTQLCRDVCHYCTFAETPRRRGGAYLSPEAVLAIAEAGRAAGCKEALFTLGDKPEARYAAARRALAELNAASTLDYLATSAERVLTTTGLLPHLNPGLLDEAWLKRLRKVSLSQGIMLETASVRLSAPGGPHYGSPDKHPARRLATLEAAGRARVPFTTGILIGIGETRRERIEALLAIRELHERYGHIQEIIIQNFRAKPGTRMAHAAEPSLDEHLWTIAVARLIFGCRMNIQAPPNLRPEALAALIGAGINDWGGVSPVTPDHVNPEAPWPHLDALRQATERAGRSLVERLAAYPEFLLAPAASQDGQAPAAGAAATPARIGRSAPYLVTDWLAAPLKGPTLRLMDGEGYAREDGWVAGGLEALPSPPSLRGAKPSRRLEALLQRALAGEALGETDVVALFAARGPDLAAVVAAADLLRARTVGDSVSFIVNRNINYTNICTYGCKFCAFSKGRHNLGHRDAPYDLDAAEIGRRSREAWQRGATEVCLQGGIRPGYTGETYLGIVAAVKAAVPDMHVHAFSPLEIWHGATSLGLPLDTYLARLKAAGLASLPGTAAEILDDEVRAILCPDKITTEQWFEVMESAHTVGLKSTATIMFGHVDAYRHWARHLIKVRRLQAKTKGFTEFVPLAFVHMEAPIYLKGQARKGPTWREAILMHAVARLVLNPEIDNIQASWVKMGPQGAVACLAAGCNDLGGVLMNESITRAAGARHGQEIGAAELEAMIRAAGRTPRQRTTLYQTVPNPVCAAQSQGPGFGQSPLAAAE
ncbi:MAG TPA: bifunctional FO biosynthesis protein CofGH [Hyphomicrobiaceae bacterium]|nr:bifunctional FO biosynthesis protein CofGH [Hyphomicrobiaceae bacterium]